MKHALSGIGLILFLAAGAWALDAGPVTVDVLSKTTRSWDGTVLPAYSKGRPEITILRITVPPGARLPVHEHPEINAGVMLKGQLTVVTEAGERLHLKAGDTIVEVVNKWHRGENPGDEPAVIVVFYAGVDGTPITIKK